MKVLVILLLALGLGACSDSGSSPAKAPDVKDFSATNFVLEKELKSDEYYNAIQKPKAPNCTEGAFDPTVRGAQFKKENFSFGQDGVSTYSRYTSVIDAVSAQRADISVNFEVLAASDFSGVFLEGNKLKLICRLVERQEGNSRYTQNDCESSFKLTSEGERYLRDKQSVPKKPDCKNEYKKDQKDENYYAQGFYNLENGKRVKAFLSSAQFVFTEKCEDKTTEYIAAYKRIISFEVVPSPDNHTCGSATLFSQSTRYLPSFAKINEYKERVISAPVR